MALQDAYEAEEDELEDLENEEENEMELEEQSKNENHLAGYSIKTHLALHFYGVLPCWGCLRNPRGSN